MPYLIAAAVLVVLVGIYVLAYVANAKTKAPEGCELPEGFSGCGGCASQNCIARKPDKGGGRHA